MAQSVHAVLGASSSHRWLECPGSIKLSVGMPNESSVYAREGSCAHAVGEACLRSGADALYYLGDEMPGYEEIEVDEVMCENVQVYLDTIRGDIAAYEGDDYALGIETKFDLSHVYPGMFGTSDANILWPRQKKLTVYDYKNGWFAVAAERNPQTMYYGLGAIYVYDNYDIETIEFVIVQPRTGQNAAVKRWECTRAELMAFRQELIRGAKATEKPDAPLRAGEWCKFCPAAPICMKLVDRCMELACAEFDLDGRIEPMALEKMSIERLKALWENASILENYAKSAKAYAHLRAMEGDLLPGTKLVAGRSHRRWKDKEGAEQRLGALVDTGFISGDIFVKKLKSPTQIEAVLPKKQKAIIANLWEKPEGRVSLVPESDARPPSKADAEAEFD